MTVQQAQANLPDRAAGDEKHARSWWWIFLLLSLWVYGIRTGCATLIILGGLETLYLEISVFMYPVQILGVALAPALLEKLGILANPPAEKRVTAGLLALSVMLLAAFFCVSGMSTRLALLFALIFCPPVAMGIALRRGAMCWREEKAALTIGMAFVLHYVCSFSDVLFYTFSGVSYAVIWLYFGFSAVLYIGAPLAAAIIRLRLGDGAVPALPPVHHTYPRRFPQSALALIAVHSLFSTAINTVIYFDNMEDFHTPSYEFFFYALAILVILSAVLLYHRRKWLFPAVTGLLLVCFGQGLSLFGIQNTQLAIAYNLVTMVGKMPPFVLTLVLPVYYAVGTRKPGLMCLGFAITTGADFLLMLTQFTEKGIGGVLPGNTRQGLLLLVGLCLIGALFALYTRFERTRTGALLAAIQEGRRERKSTRDTVDSLDLTAREKEVTTLLLAGDSQKMIAAKLQVSLSTVSFHIRNLYRKLNIQSKGELFSLFLATEPQDVA